MPELLLRNNAVLAVVRTPGITVLYPNTSTAYPFNGVDVKFIVVPEVISTSVIGSCLTPLTNTATWLGVYPPDIVKLFDVPFAVNCSDIVATALTTGITAQTLLP